MNQFQKLLGFHYWIHVSASNLPSLPSLMSQVSQQSISLHVLDSVTRKKSFHASCYTELSTTIIHVFLLYGLHNVRTKHVNEPTLENRTLLVNAPSLLSSNNPWESQLLQQDLKEIKLIEKYPDMQMLHMHSKRARRVYSCCLHHCSDSRQEHKNHIAAIISHRKMGATS